MESFSFVFIRKWACFLHLFRSRKPPCSVSLAIKFHSSVQKETYLTTPFRIFLKIAKNKAIKERVKKKERLWETASNTTVRKMGSTFKKRCTTYITPIVSEKVRRKKRIHSLLIVVLRCAWLQQQLALLPPGQATHYILMHLMDQSWKL